MTGDFNMKPTRSRKVSASRVQAASKKKKSAKSMTPPQKDFMARLHHLRSTASDVARSYLSNLEHDILEIMDVVAGRRDADGKKKRIKSDALEQMIEALDKLSIRPEKGRRKDLKKIEGAVDAITRRIFKKRK